MSSENRYRAKPYSEVSSFTPSASKHIMVKLGSLMILVQVYKKVSCFQAREPILSVSAGLGEDKI